MRAGHKKRIARLIAAEAEAVDRRCDLRVKDAICKDIRAALEWRGIDPAAAPVLLDAEAEVGEFVDSPELQARDEDFLAAHPEEEAAPEERDPEEDPLEWLEDELGQLGERYLDASQPDFTFDDLLELWAWALAQSRLLPAIPE